MITIARPQIQNQEIKAVLKVLNSGALTQGKEVAKLETAFARFIGVKYCVAVSSGTNALHLSLLAAGIRAGDEVITTPFSFIASANACLYVRAKPVFVDINPDNLTLDPHLIEALITKKTKAILPVHLYGCPAEMSLINQIAKKHHLIVIEDCCQSHGTAIGSKKTGSLGLAGCFSLYATKNMVSGEGGLITTNSLQLATLCQKLRSHGTVVRYYHEILGYNCRLTEIQAALALVQLKKLKPNNLTRKKHATFLNQKINAPGIILPEPTKGHSWHQYTIRVTKNYSLTRQQLITKLNRLKIYPEVYYPLAIHQQPLYRQLGYRDHLPIAETAAQEVLSLPIHPQITKGNLLLIATAINTA